MKKLMIRIAIAFAFAISLSLAFNPQVRTAIREPFAKDYRNVISTLKVTAKDGNVYNLVKVRTRDGLTVEVYAGSESKPTLLEKWNFEDHKDAFFTFNGDSTNFAADDTNGDGNLEILIPSIDKYMTAHLNIYEWDSSSGRFKTMKP